MEFPYPPIALMERVGKPASGYDAIGAACRRDVLAMVPSTFSWDGARVLDFGCGAGRTLRTFGDEVARTSEFWGCDIDAESIDWAAAHLCPPFRVFRNDAEPPLPLADGSIDLVYAFSVFTHLADTWSAWLLELHRVLAPGGVLIATFLGAGSETDLGRPWDEDRIGMLVTIPEESFVASSGPVVYHSEWWIREHWGRAFEIIEHRPWAHGPDGLASVRIGHGCVAMRKREVHLTTEELDRPSNDPREWTALRENIDVLHQREALWRARALDSERVLAAVAPPRVTWARRAAGRVRRVLTRARRGSPPG